MILWPMILLLALGGIIVLLLISLRKNGQELRMERARFERVSGALSDICQRTVTQYHGEKEAMEKIYDVLAKENIWYAP